MTLTTGFEASAANGDLSITPYVYQGGDGERYELTDHLGNVRATLTRSKTAEEATVEEYADYYPFGAKMLGRQQISSPKYRYGYQGQFAEHDDENGIDLHHFELRQYDSRIGRWLSVDIIKHQQKSGYVAMSNSPTHKVDPDGADDIYYDQLGNEYGELRVEKPGPNKHFMNHANGEYIRGDFTFVQVNSRQTIFGGDAGQGWLNLKNYSNETLASFVRVGMKEIVPYIELYDFAVESADGGSLDYKRLLPQQSLIGINDIYYNVNEAGNYLWGASAYTFGFDWWEAYTGAQAFSQYKRGKWDEEHELKAAKLGFYVLGKSLRTLIPKKPIQEAVKRLPRFRPTKF